MQKDSNRKLLQHVILIKLINLNSDGKKKNFHSSNERFQFCFHEGYFRKRDKFVTSDVMNWLFVNSKFEYYRSAFLPENNDVQ